MKNLEMINGLRELDVLEQSEINGGDTFWFGVGSFLGRGASFFQGVFDNPPSLSSAEEYK